VDHITQLLTNQLYGAEPFLIS